MPVITSNQVLVCGTRCTRLESVGQSPHSVSFSKKNPNLLAQYHPETVKALLLWRVTGRYYAAGLLAFNDYEQYLDQIKTAGANQRSRLCTEDGHPCRVHRIRCLHAAFGRPHRTSSIGKITSRDDDRCRWPD